MPHNREDAGQMRPEQMKTSADRGSSNATADMAVEADPDRKDHQSDSPTSRPAEPMSFDKTFDQLEKKVEKTGDRQEALLDEAIEETFPGSDPISPSHID